MPANLTPQYLEAEKRYRTAVDTEEKIRCLEEMMAVIPKHKGTEKIRADIKRRMRKHKEELQKTKATSKKGYSVHVEKEGAGQVALVGAPNVGKSQLLDSLTNAEPEIADYPFTTRSPLCGMTKFENIQFQLLDLPPVSEQHMEYWVPNLIRITDIVWLVINPSGKRPLEEYEDTIRILENVKIKFVHPNEKDQPGKSIAEKRVLVVCTHNDSAGDQENFEVLEELLECPFPMFSVSAISKKGIPELLQQTFHYLKIIRIYTKSPGKEADLKEPHVLPVGSSVTDLAMSVHKDIGANLKFARIWGSGKYDGQKVQRDYMLQDGDIVELHS